MYVILQLQHSVGDVSNSTSSTVQSLTELVLFFLCQWMNTPSDTTKFVATLHFVFCAHHVSALMFSRVLCWTAVGVYGEDQAGRTLTVWAEC